MHFDVILQNTHISKKNTRVTSTILWEKSLINSSLDCANLKRKAQMLAEAHPSTQLSNQKWVETPFLTIEHKFFVNANKEWKMPFQKKERRPGCLWYKFHMGALLK